MTAADVETEAGLDDLLDYVRQARGFDFSAYKRPSLTRRIQKRMQAVRAEGYPAYQALLEAQPDEFAELFDTILINVTSFLRDRDAWDHLAAAVIPRLLADRPPDAPIRVWSAGCASAQEVYSLAMLLCDAVGDDRFREQVKIYGTDADDGALDQARQARYPRAATADAVGPDLVKRYFEADGDSLVFRKDLRRAVIFGRHDLLRDPPISRVDLLVCRNTLMYFNADAQRRVLGNFSFALRDGGFLFLGKSEALVTRTNLFASEDAKHHVFQKRPSAGNGRSPSPRPPYLLRGGSRGTVTELLVDAFETASVAQLIVGADGTLEVANRHARSLFAIGLAHVGRPFKDLELSYRPVELRSQIEQVLADRRPVAIGDVAYEMPSGAVEFLDVRILPVGGELSRGVSVTFTQVGRQKLLREELERAQRELEAAYDDLQSTVEELETTNEELQSTNEELETTNEELHSTNEELETMNEELQSTNEELETTNGEIRRRTADLDEANAFLQSILTSLGSGVAVLGRDLSVRVWNDHAEDLWGLRADEVHGRHFLNLDIGLPVGELHQPIRSCLTGQSAAEAVVLPAVNRRGRSIRCQVAITPLLDGAATPDGVIVRMDRVDDHG